MFRNQEDQGDKGNYMSSIFPEPGLFQVESGSGIITYKDIQGHTGRRTGLLDIPDIQDTQDIQDISMDEPVSTTRRYARIRKAWPGKAGGVRRGRVGESGFARLARGLVATRFLFLIFSQAPTLHAPSLQLSSLRVRVSSSEVRSSLPHQPTALSPQPLAHSPY